MNKKSISIFILSATLVGACSNEKAPENKTAVAEKPHYELVEAQSAGVGQYINLPAQLAAYQEVSIFPKVNGYVKSVMVDIGSHVKRGQLLMELEAPELIQTMLQGEKKNMNAQMLIMQLVKKIMSV